MSLIPNNFINSVVSIGNKGSDGKYKSFGTGFLVGKKSEDGGVFPFLVTNKHVIENKNTVYIRVVKKDSDDLDIYELPLYDVDGKYLPKSFNDNEIDIAVIFLNAKFILEQFNMDKIYFLDIDANALSSSEYIDYGGNLGSPVFMLGFPMGQIDEFTNSPICRYGCMARINNREIQKHKRYLLDIQNFPGNSGSPIFSCPEFIAIKGTKAINKSSLIGIVHSYIPYEEQLINLQTKKIVETRTENSGLAIANPIEYIRELINQFFDKSK